MKRTILLVAATALPLAMCVPVAEAQGPYSPHAAKDASQMPESGPLVTGGNGATAGPNHRNQAVGPMPGLRQHEELSELPATSPGVSTVRPNPVPPPAKR